MNEIKNYWIEKRNYLIEMAEGTKVLIMVWLQSSSKFDLIAEYDPDLSTLRKASKKELGSSAPARINGFFYEFSDGLFILFNQGDKIIFESNGEKFLLDDATIVEVSGGPTNRKLDVICNGRLIYSTSYPIEHMAKFQDDPTAFIDDEDFDFGLFVSNISKDPKRKSIIIE